MSTALLADDEPHLARHLQATLAATWPELEVIAVAAHGLEAAERIAALQPDLAFLDIRMPGLTGLEVAQGIEGTTRVVFVTAHDDYAVAAFEHEALDYVLKPVTLPRLEKTVARLRRTLDAPVAAPEDALAGDARLARALRRLLSTAPQPEPLRWVRAGQGDVVTQIAVEDVLFFRSGDKYTAVHTAQGEHLIRTPIVELAAQLDPGRWMQIHRSTLINLSHLAGTRRDALSRLHVHMRGWPGELPVSRAYVHLFKAM